LPGIRSEQQQRPVDDQYGAWNGPLEFRKYRLTNACPNGEGEEVVNSVNCYEDPNRASAYATLEFANTYYLAFRDWNHRQYSFFTRDLHP
jgi:hypothetical protein